MQVILSYSYTCRCSNCALNHLQYAVNCLCCKEVQKCIESLEALLSRTKPRTWHNNRLWNNAPGIQCCLNRWSLRSDGAKYNAIDGRNCCQISSEGKWEFLCVLVDSLKHSCCINTSRQIDTRNFCTVYFRYIDQCWFITAVKIITSLICAQLDYG